MNSNVVDRSITNYGEILGVYGLDYVSAGYYWQVGNITRTQGWILHLSVIKMQVVDLFHLIIPFLMQKKVAFKIARDFETVSSLLDGGLGYIHVGKIISIYPDDDADPVALAVEIIELSSGFKGPSIPTDRHLGGILYTRYGSFSAILKNDERGNPVKYIYNASGALIADPYEVPFSCPVGISWPFGKIAPAVPIKYGKLLNGSYYPLVNLKPDVKGNVIKALYFQKWNRIRSCLIKEGKQWMLTDMYGRDIRDRLKWQYDLYHTLKETVPMPEVFDYFTQGYDSYLAMAFIKGISVNAWISNIYKGRSWHDISVRSKMTLLEKLVEIVGIVVELHGKGYIHRDINSNNFIIDGNGKIWLIDMELAWSIKEDYPQPAFLLGSPGFMSPEQRAQDHPEFQQDIYAVGALAQEFFTGLYPLMLDQDSGVVLKESLLFLTGNAAIAHWVSICQAVDAHMRPKLRAFYEYLKTLQIMLASADNSLGKENTVLSREKIQTTIKKGLDGLVYPDLLHPRWGWVSIKQQVDKFIGNPQIEVGLYEGWHTGMAGPLWLIGKFKVAGVDIDPCLVAYRNSWQYIKDHYIKTPSIYPSGLYSGGQGICMALVEGIRSGLISLDVEAEGWLESCLSHASSQLDIYNGWAGKGLAILSAEDCIDAFTFKKLLAECIHNILISQREDGSWNVISQSKKKDDILIGLDRGVAGIIWFLLTVLTRNDDPTIKKSVIKGLTWLVNKGHPSSNGKIWPISIRSKSIDLWNPGSGNPGVALVFIKAFEVLGDQQYREIAERNLLELPQRPIIMDFCLGSGLAGIGEVYLEASRVFKSDIWKERVEWITTFLIHSCKKHDDTSGYWMSTTNSIVTADLFSGNSGILHFLYRAENPDKIGHPLWPCK